MTITHTIEVNQLDTITKHLIDINQQLVQIGKETSADNTLETIKTIGLVVSPFLTGFLIFILTRGKEHHEKKSELCGEIYSKIVELRAIVVDCSLLKIYTGGYARIAELKAIEESEPLYNQDTDDELLAVEYLKRYNRKRKDLKSCILEYRKIISALSKAFGQYRLYLPTSKRKEFDKLSRPIEKMKAIEYSFSDIHTIHNVNLEMNQKNKIFRADLRTKYTTHINSLQKFIDENSSSNMFDEAQQ